MEKTQNNFSNFCSQPWNSCSKSTSKDLVRQSASKDLVKTSTRKELVQSIDLYGS